METTMFAFGVFSTIVVIAVAALVYNIVKVFKLKKELQESLELITSIEYNLTQAGEQIHRRIDDVERVMGQEFHETKSYIDRRFDKTTDSIANNIADLWRRTDELSVETGKKQLIKG